MAVDDGRSGLLYPADLEHDRFKDESEVRAIATEFSEPSPIGMPIAVDLSALIEAVVMSPQAPDHLLRVLQHVLPPLGVEAPIHRSVIPRSRIV